MSARRKYDWTKPPRLQAHSRAKHFLYRDYLLEYVRVVTARPNIDHLNLTVVDGFCGGGLYTDEISGDLVPGSPILVLDALRDACSEARERRTKDFRVNVHFRFVDEDPQALLQLREVIENFGYGDGLKLGTIELIQGRFEDRLDQLLVDLGSRSRVGQSIWILDQYGYDAVSIRSLRKILGYERAEVILTFLADDLADHLADTPSMETRIRLIGFQRSLAEFVAAKERAKGLVGTREWRLPVQTLFYQEFRDGTGVQYLTSFFLERAHANRSYWLVHMAHRWRANEVMKDVHWTKHNAEVRFTSDGGAGFDMYGIRPHLGGLKDLPQQVLVLGPDAEAVGQRKLNAQIELVLDGRGRVSLRDLFIEHTNEMPHSLPALLGWAGQAAKEGRVELFGPNGGSKRGDVANEDDFVCLPSQLSFLLYARDRGSTGEDG